jgi:uncharacterized surface protein with fasciclin (FAS1) repeats
MKVFASILLIVVVCGGCKVNTEKYAIAQEQAKLPGKDVVDTIASAKTCSTFLAAIQGTQMDTALRRPGPYTVLVPTDAAWAKLPGGYVQSVFKPENSEVLRALVKNHVIAGLLLPADMAGRNELVTSNGIAMPLRHTDTQLYIGPARVITPNIPAENGTIYIIDTVLIPPAPKPQ